MHKLRHFYYQNKKEIWKVVLIIAFVILIIQFADKLIMNKNKQETTTNISTNSNTVYENEETQTYISDKTAISGGTVTKEEVTKINNTISKFLDYCKKEKFEEAYNMLSSDCKENKYKTLENFTQKYAKAKFNKNQVFEIESWIGNTYKISISEDLLATGNVKNTEKSIEYITIVKENSQNKLNINSYIGKVKIGKETIKNNIQITVESREKYLDYEIYNFTIKNMSNNTIKLDSLENTGTMYIESTKGNKYKAYTHEILEEELEIKSKEEIKISIKYANTYSKSTTIKSIIFENINLDYIKNKETKNTCEIEIRL